MAVASSWYGKSFEAAFNKEIDLGSDDIRAMLTDSSYVPSGSHKYKSDVTGEIVASGYTAGGKVLTTPTVGFDPLTNQFVFTADDVSWTPSSITDARNAVIYDRTPATDATRPLIYVIQFGVDVDSVSGLFEILWADAGIGRVTVI